MTPEQIKAEQGSFRNKNAELRRSEMPKYTGTFMILKAKMNVKMAIRSSITEPDNNEKKKTQMKEYVKDIIVKIFKSQVDDIESDMKNRFMSIIEMSFGREYFIRLISHNEKIFLSYFGLSKYQNLKILFSLYFYNYKTYHTYPQL